MWLQLSELDLMFATALCCYITVAAELACSDQAVSGSCSIWLAGMIAMKETLAQLPADHANARKLAEGTAHLAIQNCMVACRQG